MRRFYIPTILGAYCALILALMGGHAQADTASLKAAVLKVGTVNWELNTILHNGYDQQNGFNLEVTGMANNAATRIAFQAGDVDMMVADWIWVARQRAEGKDYQFIPYSKSVGGLLVAADSSITSLDQLAGKKIGIAGGPVDKSWLLMQGLAKQRHGIDLAAQTEQVFGAPPLIFKKALQGELDAVINFWHFSAKLEAKGLKKLVNVQDAAIELGLSPNVPLLGYVVNGETARAHPELINGFIKASRAAKALLATDDAAWDRLRPNMRANDDASFTALKVGWRAGIPSADPIDTGAVDKVLKLMGQLGGDKLVGKASVLPAGVFYGQ